MCAGLFLDVLGTFRYAHGGTHSHSTKEVLMIFVQCSPAELALSRAVVGAWRTYGAAVAPSVARFARATCNAELDVDDRVSLECVSLPSSHRRLKSEARAAAHAPGGASWEQILAHYILNNAQWFSKKNVELACTVCEAAL